MPNRIHGATASCPRPIGAFPPLTAPGARWLPASFSRPKKKMPLAEGGAGAKEITMRNIPHNVSIDHAIQRGAHEIFYSELTVTPDVARQLLRWNPNNRNVQRKLVSRYAAAMRAGEWAINGQNIIVAQDGHLNDGQHRLLAVIAADCPVRMGFMFGLPRSTRSTLDQGARRTSGHILTMAGEKDTNILAGTLRFLICAERDNFSSDVRTAEIEAELERCPGVRDAVALARPLFKKFGLSPSGIAAAVYMCSRVDSGCNDRLLAAAVTGIGIDHKGAPEALLRDRYIGHSASKSGRLTSQEQAAMYIKSFNGLRSGRHLKQLRYRVHGKLVDKFPRPE